MPTIKANNVAGGAIVITIQLPPLRERKGDVAILATTFALEHARGVGKEIREIDPKFLAVAQGDPNTSYHDTYWEIGPDEAFVIDLEPPEWKTREQQRRSLDALAVLNRERFKAFEQSRMATVGADGAQQSFELCKHLLA